MEFAKVEYDSSLDRRGIPRHKGDGRPKIFPEGGGKGTFYTRTTTYIDCLGDKSSLNDWKLRQVLKGLSRRPDLMEDYARIGDPDGHEKRKALAIAERALDVAGASHKADAGTDIHDAIEAELLGQPWDLSPDLVPDITAFTHATKGMGLTVLATEVFSVNDELSVAGSADYIMHWPDRELNVISDTKTGSAYYGKTAMQEAIYARSKRYNPTTFERRPLLHSGSVSVSVGLFIHVPLGQGICEIRELDLEQGWKDVLLAGEVREVRKRWARKSAQPGILARFNSAGECLDE